MYALSHTTSHCHIVILELAFTWLGLLLLRLSTMDFGNCSNLSDTWFKLLFPFTFPQLSEQRILDVLTDNLIATHLNFLG